MSGQVVLYFEDQTDALRFALAAGNVMAGDGVAGGGVAGEGTKSSTELVQKTARVTRIRLNASNTGKARHPGSPERVA